MHNMHMFIPHSRNFPAFNNSDVEELKGFLIRFNYHYFVDRFSVWRNFFSRFSPQGSLSVMMQERAIAFLGISFEQMKPYRERERWERVNNQGGEPARETGLNELPPQLLEPTQCGHTQLPAHIEIHRSGPAAKVFLHKTQFLQRFTFKSECCRESTEMEFAHAVLENTHLIT